MAYQPIKISRSAFVPLRGLRYHIREWGEPNAPLLVLLHGWMDVSASWQFMVDHLQRDWHVVAPDWRGFGLTEYAGEPSGYWFPDYYADLDALLDHFSPEQPVNLVGHSMGGVNAMIYSGVRPHRIQRLVNLEGVGLPGPPPERAPERLARWMDELRDPPRLKTYADLKEIQARLQKTNARLSDEKAEWLAGHWSRQEADGRYSILADPAHKIANPYLYRVDEVVATWACITAPILFVMARQSEAVGRVERMKDYPQRLAAIRDLRRAWLDEAGHMMHHDQPVRIAQLIEEFFA